MSRMTNIHAFNQSYGWQSGIGDYCTIYTPRPEFKLAKRPPNLSHAPHETIQIANLHSVARVSTALKEDRFTMSYSSEVR
jgi:hypothetical protein